MMIVSRDSRNNIFDPIARDGVRYHSIKLQMLLTISFYLHNHMAPQSFQKMKALFFVHKINP